MESGGADVLARDAENRFPASAAKRRFSGVRETRDAFASVKIGLSGRGIDECVDVPFAVTSTAIDDLSAVECSHASPGRRRRR